MNTRLKCTLEKAILEWSEKEACSDEWAEVGYVGDNFVLLMTDAASVVLDCCADVQKYHDKQGNLK